MSSDLMNQQTADGVGAHHRRVGRLRQALVQIIKTGTGTATVRVLDVWNDAVLFEFALGAGTQAVTAPMWLPHEYKGQLLDVSGDVVVSARIDGPP